MRIRNFDELKSWKKARELVREVYRITELGLLARDFSLKDQMRRSAVSVMANIAEGFGRGGNREFIHFLSIARASCSEVSSHLIVAHDVGYVTSNDFKHIYSLCDETGKLITGFISYLRHSSFKGSKFG